MARFSPEEIERIKRDTDIIALIQSCGTVLKKRESKPGEWIGRCPIHDDSDPSLCVNSDKNVWLCNGAWQKGGDVIQSFAWAAYLQVMTTLTVNCPRENLELPRQ